MCEPATVIAAASAGISLVGSGLQAWGQHQDGQHQGWLLDKSAEFSDAAAADSVRRGDREVADIRLRTSQILGEQRVALGSSGVDAGVGSAADLQADTRMMSELDVETTRNNAAREAWGYQVQAWNQRQQATFARKGGGAAAAGTLLGGVGRAAGDAAGIYAGHMARNPPKAKPPPPRKG